jgi:hypothetical protein
MATPVMVGCAMRPARQCEWRGRDRHRYMQSPERRARALPKRPHQTVDPEALIRPRNQRSLHIVGVTQFERFFRIAAGLDIDKADLKRYSDFVNRKIYDLLIRSEAAAKANGRDIIEPFDLPITKGLQESIYEFRKLDAGIELKPIVDHLIAHPPLDLACAEETEAKLPEVAGGLSLALARTFKIIDPNLKNPQLEHWERAFRIFDLLL